MNSPQSETQSAPSETQQGSPILACPMPMPSQEAERQAELEQYLQLGALPKEAFEDITAILAQVCETPIAFVSLISNDTQILASERGLGINKTPRAVSFCTYAILTPEDVMVIPDAQDDPRFINNPLVSGPPHLRFYAGAPLVSPRGYALGSLCAMDYKPRQLRLEQLKALTGLSRQVVAQMELQLNVRKLELEVERRERTEKILLEEKRKSEKLVLNILPRTIAEQLKYSPGAIAERFDDVSILFADLVDFTRLAGEMRPVELVGLLNEIVSEFDGLVERHGLEKIKTIGDAYMAVGGLPNPSEDHPSAIANLAIDMQDAITKFGKNRNLHLGLRIGINTGPVIAGTIGRMKYAYDLWGDAVNVASRMESAGDTGKIHVNENTYLRIKDSYDFIARGEIPIKGKGLLSTYWLDCPACQDS